jgi:hypothetical protein
MTPRQRHPWFTSYPLAGTKQAAWIIRYERRKTGDGATVERTFYLDAALGVRVTVMRAGPRAVQVHNGDPWSDGLRITHSRIFDRTEIAV